MNKKAFFIGLIVISIVPNGYSHITYALKSELGYMKFIYNTVTVEPGPNWKGYYLDNQNGFDFSITNGIKFKEKIYTGVGVGYLNFDGINGVSLLSDFEFLALKYRLTPLIGIKFGYSHLWNQYESGTGTALAEIDLGFNFKLSDKFGVFAKIGCLFTQQSLLIPIKIGFRF